MKPLEHEDGDRPVRSPLDEARECIEQAIADLESQAEWIERKGDPQAHIKGRGEQAMYELIMARSALARLAAALEE